MKHWKKRLASLALALVMALGMAPALAPAASAVGTFSDVTDLTTAQNLEVLGMMGVVDGMTGSTFNPTGTLTRAQFCKMAVEAMGEGDRANIYKNYTIFPDVKPGYWAAGYVNLAVRSDPKLISGYADGTFGPNDTITFGQAVTILMRMLGYKDEDVSAVWPDGYIDEAMSIGLCDGVSLSATAHLSRAQAASSSSTSSTATRRTAASSTPNWARPRRQFFWTPMPGIRRATPSCAPPPRTM